MNARPFFRNRGYIDQRTLFQALRFDSVTSIDYSAYEGSSVILDLNAAETPDALHAQFDFVFDGGTMEHIFHVPNVLKHLPVLACAEKAASGWSDTTLVILSSQVYEAQMLSELEKHQYQGSVLSIWDPVLSRIL